MKKNKKQMGILMIFFILVTSISLAYMFRKTNSITNLLKPAVVSCEVYEMVNDSDTEQPSSQIKVTTKNSITVKNTGNIEAYIRVKLVTYWVNEKGQVIGKSSPKLTVEFNQNDWVYYPQQEIYYYKYPVSPTQSTSNLLSNSIPLNPSITEYQVIDVFAEAIQSQPSNAVINSWQVKINESQSIYLP